MENKTLLYDVREDVKDIYEKWFTEYHRIAKESLSNAISNLNPGEKVPNAGIIYGDAYKESFRQATRSYKEDIDRILDKEENRIRDNMAQAPSEEATRAVNMFLLRAPQTDISGDPERREKFLYEIDSLMTKYPDYLTYTALEEIAEKAGLLHEFKAPETMNEFKLMRKLRDMVNRNFNTFAIPNGLPEAQKALFENNIDHLEADNPLFA